MIHKPVSAQPLRKVVLSTNFSQYAKQVATSERWGLCLYVLVPAFAGQYFGFGALQHWLSVTEHKSKAAVMHSSRQLCLQIPAKIGKIGRKMTWMRLFFFFEAWSTAGWFFWFILLCFHIWSVNTLSVGFWFWSLRFISLDLQRQVLGSMQV